MMESDSVSEISDELTDHHDDIIDSVITINVGIKRKVNRSEWLKEKAKKKRNSGKSYISPFSHKLIARKKYQSAKKCCLKNCFSQFDDSDQNVMFEGFWKLEDKNKQDTVLLGLLELNDVSKNVKNPKSGKNRSFSITYNVRLHAKKVPVCKQFLMSVFQITESRMKTVINAAKQGLHTVEDKRGKHNRPKKIDETVWNLVKSHWDLFPSTQSHYSLKKSKRKYYDNTTLNVTKLYTLFKEYYFKETGNLLKMKYKTYHKFFLENSPYSFRKPRTDVCDFCRESELILKTKPNDERKIEFNLHQRKVKQYNIVKKKCLDSLNNNNLDTLVIEFDYGQNLCLPKLNVTAQFYRRLLWLYIFNIHCHNDSTSKFYCFMEHEAKKNPNSVCSFLFEFLTEKLQEYPLTKHIVFLSDSAGGQNKNSTVMRFCAWFSCVYNVTIKHILPVRGHSYGQCDRNFGLYGNMLKHVETIESAEQYIGIINKSRDKPKAFEAKMASYLIEDWSSALDPFFLKKPKSKGKVFRIQKCVSMYYSKHTFAVAFVYADLHHPYALVSEKNLSEKRKECLTFLPVKKPGLKLAKKKDVECLLKFVDDKYVPWYQDILLLSSTSNDQNNENEESESEEC